MQLGPCQNDPTGAHRSSQSTFFFYDRSHRFKTFMGADVSFQWNEFTSGDALKRSAQGIQFLFGTRWNKHSCALLQKRPRNPFSDFTSSARNYDSLFPSSFWFCFMTSSSCIF